MADSVLRELASLYDITIDGFPAEAGQPVAETDGLLALLRAAGVPIGDPHEADRLLRRLRLERCRKILEPVEVISVRNMPVTLPVRLAETDGRHYQWTLIEEDGRQHDGSFLRTDLVAMADSRDDSHSCRRYLLDLNIALSPGYHQFVIHDAGQNQDLPAASLLLIVTPEHSYLPPSITGECRAWGISGHLHAVRSGKNWGIGDFSDLRQLLVWSAAQGAAALHIAPLHCISSVEFPNPYLPSCRSRLNVLFIDIEAIADFAEADEVRCYVGDPRFQARLAALRTQQQIDYQAVAGIKEEVLEKLWNHFSSNHLNPESARGREFREFQLRGGKTLRYFAIFHAIATTLSEERQAADSSPPDWRNWPPPLQNPHSPEVAAFTEQHERKIEYFQYLQWQAGLQLAAVGRRSMELGLRIGLLTEFPYSSGPGSFENWYYDGVLLPEAVMAKKHSGPTVIDPAEGLPPLSPSGLKKHCYKPFIEGLSHTMRHAGAIIIRSFADYFRVVLSPADRSVEQEVSLIFPFADLLGILTLESQRNRCLVIVDQHELLPEELQSEIVRRNIFTTAILFAARNQQDDWLELENYPVNSVVGTAAPFLASMKGFWLGRDISIKTEEKYFLDASQKEQAILARVADRAHFLIHLDRQGLLPEGYSLDPAAVPEIGRSLIAAGQILLARSAAKILLVSLLDLQGIEAQAEPPAMAGQHFWRRRSIAELENLTPDQDTESLFAALCRERGKGVVHPSVLAPERRKGQGLQLPTSFYRLQLNKDFSFRQAAELIPYLKDLGISHCYVSPFLTAKPGSTHGYDIIDHCSLNPEIGSREEFEGFMAALKDNRMALLLDIVPNHMGIGSDNLWWMDVLENGESSRYAVFFDINWQPQQPDLTGRVLLPVLGDHYGKILESSQLTLCFDTTTGSFSIAYYTHRFPIDPATYPGILQHDLQRLSARLGHRHNGFLELQNLIRSFENLPGTQGGSPEGMRIRHREKEVSKRILARLCRECLEIQQFIEENVILFNGEPGKPQSFDLLHELLEKQPYRLAFWRVAADEINYRRFFDINDLAGLRMEEEEVFRATHRLILDLIETGKVDGVRVDHPDGLYDPRGYFRRLVAAAAGESLEKIPTTQTDTGNGKKLVLYIVAEKILSHFEHLPDNWPICGTTGYDFANLLNGLLLDSSAEARMTALYHRFIGSRLDFEELVYACKKLIIDSAMVGELNVLATLLFRLARANRLSRDFTLNRLRQALIEIIACFPVYRTYIDSTNIQEGDVHTIEWAVARAKQKQQLHDVSIFDFIKDVLLLPRHAANTTASARHLDFIMKFQQYTGPVMAKGLEDTAFYIYNRLLSLNEVGGEPGRFGISLPAFHRANRERLQHWPHTMLSSSTHDSKRSEDVRARINVLTEMTPKWQQKIYHWRKQNRRLRTQLETMIAPDRNDEYAFYQNLLGVWPTSPPDDQEGHSLLIRRLRESMLKACREAKVHTSWTSPHTPYEEAISSFVENSLAPGTNRFLEDFVPFQQEVAWFGMLNSLSQVFLKLVSPGIPDIYQGNEIWRFCLVDPDNRRAVDFQKRRTMLSAMRESIETISGDRSAYLQELLTTLTDGRAKMFVIACALQLRKSWPEVFESGGYIPLEVTGKKSNHLCAFARQTGDRIVVAAAPRLFYTLMQGRKELPLGEQAWEDTEVRLPSGKNWGPLENMFTGKSETGEEKEENSILFPAAQLLRSWPLALLRGTHT